MININTFRENQNFSLALNQISDARTGLTIRKHIMITEIILIHIIYIEFESFRGESLLENVCNFDASPKIRDHWMLCLWFGSQVRLLCFTYFWRA